MTRKEVYIMFKFIEKSEIANLRKEAEKRKLVLGFEKHIAEMAKQGYFKTNIIAVMRAAGVRSFDQSFVDYLHKTGFACTTSFDIMNEEDDTISWEGDTAKEGFAYDMQLLARAYIKECLNGIKIYIKDAIEKDPYVTKIELQESKIIPGARRVLREMGYSITRSKRTINDQAVFEIEL